MDYSPITSWLRKKAAAEAALNFVSGALILCGGLLVVTVSFGTAYVLVWVVSHTVITSMSVILFNQRVELPVAVHLLGAAILTGALFAGNARLRREYSRRPGQRGGTSRMDDSSTDSLVHLLAYPGVSSRHVTDFLYVGPRLTGIGFDHLRKATRLWRMDVEACSLLLIILASHASRVTLNELARVSGIPDPHKILSHLRDVDGVVHLHQDPPGLAITSELRRELSELMTLPIQSGICDDPQETAGSTTPDLHKLLGVSPGATLEEIEVAYRKWIAQSTRTGAPGVRRPSDQNAEAVKATYEAFLRQPGMPRSAKRGSDVGRVWEQYKQTGK